MPSNYDAEQLGQSLEGRLFKLSNAEERRKVIDLAFDYRGDVTLELQSGERLEGYIYDRDHHQATPFLRLFPKNQASPREVIYEEVLAIIFSGQDTASGKSWEEWVRKKQKDSGNNQSS